MAKNLPANAEDAGSISGLRRFLGEGNSNPLKYSCPGNPTVREAWWVTVHGVEKESDTTQQLNTTTTTVENGSIFSNLLKIKQGIVGRKETK